MWLGPVLLLRTGGTRSLPVLHLRRRWLRVLLLGYWLLLLLLLWVLLLWVLILRLLLE